MMLSLLLSGCGVKQSAVPADQISTMDTRHWITNSETQDKIQQGLTAYLAMDGAFESIASRLYLIREAKSSLDLQYYIWSDDFIGRLMLHELLLAADRGVKVRILIDDQNGRDLDPHFQAIMQHPNIQIKIYNPYRFRTLRVIDYIFRTQQINRRMHNKLIVADGIVAVTGGRNISSEYFDASDSFQFVDLDVLFMGNVVKDANQMFIQFWNHSLSQPIQHLISSGNAQDLKDFRSQYKNSDKKDIEISQLIEQRHSILGNQLQNSQVNWARTQFLSDVPEKTLGQSKGQQQISTQIMRNLGVPKEELDLVSAYFVPTQQGTQYLAKIAQQGVELRVLTNSFHANDVVLVHAYYQQYRQALLQAGVQLYEFKPYIEREKRTWYEVATGNVIPAKGKNRSSLHAKFVNVDQKTFIGSFNFDPRSLNLNTEVGLLIESDQLQENLSQMLDQSLERIAYELRLDEQGNVEWVEHLDNGQIKTYAHDPHTTKFQRFMMYSIAKLPFEWMM